MAFDKAVIICTGLGKPRFTNTGLVKCQRELSKQVPASTVVELYRWDHYERILDDLERWEPQEIVFIGHSYGTSCLAFVSEKMQEIWPNVRIDDFLSTDGVWREDIDRIDRDSLSDDHKIIIPNNVDRLYTWRQRKGPIRGHGFEIKPPTTWEVDIWVGNSKHIAMDRNEQFLELAKEIALK